MLCWLAHAAGRSQGAREWDLGMTADPQMELPREPRKGRSGRRGGGAPAKGRR
jgi:hypothetical protein